MANILKAGVRRGRTDAAFCEATLAYLELAQWRELPLATLDGESRAAAEV